jgi:hypothetical protein
MQYACSFLDRSAAVSHHRNPNCFPVDRHTHTASLEPFVQKEGNE